jgi:hypothetical protein
LALVVLAQLQILAIKEQVAQILRLAELHLLAVVVAEQQALHLAQIMALALVEVVEAEPQVTTLPTTLVALELQVKATREALLM